MRIPEPSRLGIFGGTFNPVHIGHLILAQDALERFELDEILWMPCYDPPHKSSDSLAGIEHRLNMLDLALEDHLSMHWSDLEVRRMGTSYTIDTLLALRKEHPHAKLFFMIGADTLFELQTWRRIQEVLGLCTFLSFARPGFDLSQVTPEALGFSPEQTDHLRNHILQGHLIEVSSSEIRARTAEGLSIQYLVPRAVEMYIQEHRLYQS